MLEASILHLVIEHLRSMEDQTSRNRFGGCNSLDFPVPRVIDFGSEFGYPCQDNLERRPSSRDTLSCSPLPRVLTFFFRRMCRILVEVLQVIG